MTISRKFFRFGFAIYLFSFLLPATMLYDTPLYGFMSAYLAVGLLFDPTAIIDHYLIVAANLANLSTVLVFILHFKVSLRKLLPLQLLAFLSASCLGIAGLIQSDELGPLFIGYWNWLLGIFIMLVVIIRTFKATHHS